MTVEMESNLAECKKKGYIWRFRGVIYGFLIGSIRQYCHQKASTLMVRFWLFWRL